MVDIIKDIEEKEEQSGKWLPIILAFVFLNGFLEYYLYCKYVLREPWEKSFKRFAKSLNYLALLLWLTIGNYVGLYFLIKLIF